MTLLVEIWEDSGAIDINTGLPTIRQEVDNIGHKSNGSDETFPFVDYPITRPSPGSFNQNENAVFSFHKYNYFKFSGTYPKAAQVRLIFNGGVDGEGQPSIASNVRLVYRWTNVYAEPTNEMLNGAILDGVMKHVPMLSTTGPETATGLIPFLDENGTYYSNYLVTQLMIDKSDLEDWGNIDLLEVKVEVHEYETGEI
jgi:hypothetical protein